jgi:hypothetical protein
MCGGVGVELDIFLTSELDGHFRYLGKDPLVLTGEKARWWPRGSLDAVARRKKMSSLPLVIQPIV